MALENIYFDNSTDFYLKYNDFEIGKTTLFDYELKDITSERIRSKVKTPDLSDVRETRFLEDVNIPFSYSPSRIQVSSNITFSNEIEREIINSIPFRNFIKEIELGINEFLESYTVFLRNSLIFEQDWEDLEFNKIVLFLNFGEIPFKTQMQLWRKFSNIIFERIKSIIRNITELKDTFQNLKNRLFIKLQLI